MRKSALAICTVLFACTVHAKEYGRYDPNRAVAVSETASGKKASLDGAYLDRIINDLASHAKSYPVQFDTPQDRQRAVQDVKTLSGLLDLLIGGPSPNPELLARAGFLHSIGHNLDIPGSAQKADAIFQRLLAAAPADPRGNYLYGTFLAGAGKPKQALPYLEKALAVGVTDAAYSIGMAHLALGDKDSALASLEAYKRRNASDERIDKLIDAIRSGRVEFKKSPG